MSYTVTNSFAAPPGATLYWSAAVAGVIDATLRNQTSGFYQGPSGVGAVQAGYEFRPTLPDGFRGVVHVHTGTIPGTGNLWTGATWYGTFALNPGEVEKPEAFLDAKVSDAATAAGTAAAGVSTILTAVSGVSGTLAAGVNVVQWGGGGLPDAFMILDPAI